VAFPCRHAPGRGEATPTRFVCECSDSGCTETIALPIAVYEDVRSHPRHVRTDDYVVVEKTGGAGRVAERTDPRDV
jgi:hypothetical protein